MEELIKLDEQLFYFINTGMSNAFFDFILPFCRNKYFWAPLYAFVFFAFIFNFKSRQWLALLAVILVITLADQASSSLLKPHFNRSRPCQTKIVNNAEVNLLINCGSGKSMPSSHATNHFAIAFFMGMLFYKKNKLFLIIGLFWAGLVSFSQIYVGVHYPFDVLVGAVLGTVIALAILVPTKTLLFYNE